MTPHLEVQTSDFPPVSIVQQTARAGWDAPTAESLERFELAVSAPLQAVAAGLPKSSVVHAVDGFANVSQGPL